jgi:hypothetical protein
MRDIGPNCEFRPSRDWPGGTLDLPDSDWQLVVRRKSGTRIIFKDIEEDTRKIEHNSHIDYDFWKIRALLSQGFTVAELRRFCSYEPAFEEILDELPKGEDRKSEVVEELINFAKRRRLIGNVLKWAKRANPRLYGELGPYHRVPPTDEVPGTDDVV